MIWVVLVIAFFLGLSIGGVVFGFREYRKGYRDGYHQIHGDIFLY